MLTRRKQKRGEFSACKQCGAHIPRKKRKAIYIEGSSFNQTHKRCCQGWKTERCKNCRTVKYGNFKYTYLNR